MSVRLGGARLVRGVVSGAGPEMPVLTIESGRPGETVAVTANLHGDECTGIGVIFNLIERLGQELTRGTVHLYPTLNPKGLQHGTRDLPGHGGDPNRHFPGRVDGEPAERHTARVWGDLVRRAPALLIDLHTDSGASVPYAITDRVVQGAQGMQRKALSGACRALAVASGLTVLGEYPAERYRRFGLDKSLSGALVNLAGVPAVTLEVGPRRRIDVDAVATAEAAVMGILTHRGLADCPAASHPSRVGGGPWRRESGPRTAKIGVLVPAVVPGQHFLRDQVLARVYDADGSVLESLRARTPGFVVSLPERASVGRGESCATVAILDTGSDGM